MSSNRLEGVEGISGDIFLDRLLGWTVLVLALAVVLFSLVIPHKEAPASSVPVAFAHYRLLVLTCVGSLFLTRANRLGYLVAIFCFVVRVLADTADMGVHHGDRFISMSWTFDLLMVVYVFFRLRASRN